MNDEQKEILRTLLPYLLWTAVITLVIVVGLVRFGHLAPRTGGPANVVTFDIIRYTNAQRAFASQFLTKKQVDDASLLMDLSKKTRASIAKYAGANTVIIKQAVVQGDIPDITDDVLKDLGLPTNVPTQDPASYALDEAPTNFIIPQMVQDQHARKLTGAVPATGVLP